VRGTFPSRKPGWIVRSALAFVAQASCLWGHWASRPMIVCSDIARCPGETPRLPTGKMPVLLMLPATPNTYPRAITTDGGGRINQNIARGALDPPTLLKNQSTNRGRPTLNSVVGL